LSIDDEMVRILESVTQNLSEVIELSLKNIKLIFEMLYCRKVTRVGAVEGRFAGKAAFALNLMRSIEHRTMRALGE